MDATRGGSCPALAGRLIDDNGREEFRAELPALVRRKGHCLLLEKLREVHRSGIVHRAGSDVDGVRGLALFASRRCSSGVIARPEGFEPWRVIFCKYAMSLAFRRQSSRIPQVLVDAEFLQRPRQSPRIDPSLGDVFGDGAP